MIQSFQFLVLSFGHHLCSHPSPNVFLSFVYFLFNILFFFGGLFGEVVSDSSNFSTVATAGGVGGGDAGGRGGGGGGGEGVGEGAGAGDDSGGGVSGGGGKFIRAKSDSGTKRYLVVEFRPFAAIQIQFQGRKVVDVNWRVLDVCDCFVGRRFVQFYVYDGLISL